MKEYIQSSVAKALKETEWRKKPPRNIIIDTGTLERPKSAGEEVCYYDPGYDASSPELQQPFYINVELIKRQDPVKVSPDPDFMINMKLRQQERARRREQIRLFHKAKEDEKVRLQLEEEANRIRTEREEQERLKEERRELRRKIKAKEEIKLKVTNSKVAETLIPKKITQPFKFQNSVATFLPV